MGGGEDGENKSVFFVDVAPEGKRGEVLDEWE
jgi:hypothetical protein